MQTARQLSPRDWLVLVEAWWALLGSYFALRWMKFDHIQALISSATGNGAVSSDVLAWAWRRQRLVSIAASVHLLSMTCLPRALALLWMASRHGIPAILSFYMGRNTPERRQYIMNHLTVDAET